MRSKGSTITSDEYFIGHADPIILDLALIVFIEEVLADPLFIEVIDVALILEVLVFVLVLIKVVVPNTGISFDSCEIS